MARRGSCILFINVWEFRTELETHFFKGNFPEGYRYDFDPFLFNLPANLSLQDREGWISFYAVRTERKLVKGHVHFHIQDGIAVSPYRNPFGCFEFSDALTPKELYDFIRYVEEGLQKRDVSRIEIKCYPQLYHGARAAMLSTFLVNHGFKVQSAELSACIQVSPSKLFESLSSWEKRKLRQQRKSELRFSQVPMTRFREVYHFIESCRLERKQSLSMTIGQLEAVVKTFPDAFILFGAFDNQAFAAASISIRINKTILYNFYSAHAKLYNNLSPVVGMVEAMYEYCQQEGITLLDLGTSSLRAKPNFALLDFKINLGATPSSKFTFYKDL